MEPEPAHVSVPKLGQAPTMQEIADRQQALYPLMFAAPRQTPLSGKDNHVLDTPDNCCRSHQR